MGSSSRSAAPRAPDLRRQLVGAASIMMAAFLLSRATGLLRTVAISYRYATGPEIEAYFAANRLSDFLFQVVVGGAVSAAFIPVLSGYLARDDRAGAWRMVSALFTLAVVAVGPLAILLAIFAPQVIAVTAGGFDPDKQRLAAELLPILVASPLFFALGTFTTSVLNAHQRFLLAALAPTVYNLGIIFGALVLSGPLGVHGLALGTVLGAACYLLIQLPGLVRCGFLYRPTFGLADPGVRRVGWLMLPRTFGLAVAQINFLVILVLASPIPGAVAALEYAWTLVMLPLGIFAMAISTAVFPTLASQGAQDRRGDMSRTLGSALRVILYLTIPSTVGLLLLAEPIVRLLLQRGEFTAESTALTVYALRFYVLGLLGMAAVEIVTRAFYALEDTRTPVVVSAGAMLLHVVLALLLRPVLGYGGLALSISVAALLEAAALLLIARRRLGDVDEARLLRSAGRSLAGALALGAAVLPAARAVEAALPGSGLLERGLAVLGPVALGGAVYLAVTVLLRSEEPRLVFGLVRRRIG